MRTQAEQEHFNKYDALAQWVGVDILCAVVVEMLSHRYVLGNTIDRRWNRFVYIAKPIDPKPSLDSIRTRLREAAEKDEHLNNIPWDAQHDTVCQLINAARSRDKREGRLYPTNGRSLSETVCLLKHVAREYFARDYSFDPQSKVLQIHKAEREFLGMMKELVAHRKAEVALLEKLNDAASALKELKQGHSGPSTVNDPSQPGKGLKSGL